MLVIRNTGWILIGLCLLMAATRFEHFGSITTLPDASLAIFFFGGLYLRNTEWFVLLLIEAVFIDFIAIQYGGVGDFCISPAYAFLIPTYGVLWASGTFSRRFNLFTANGFLAASSIFILSVSIAFLISNSSFYLLSGKVTDISWTQYIDQVQRYYSRYLLSALVYASMIVVAHGATLSTVATKQHSSH